LRCSSVNRKFFPECIAVLATGTEPERFAATSELGAEVFRFRGLPYKIFARNPGSIGPDVCERP
jgi:hypothetical protein